MKNFASLRKGWLKVLLPAVIFMLVVFAAGLHYKMPIEDLTRDPNAVSSLNPFTGAVSTIGLFFWSFTIAVCVFTSFFSRMKMNKLYTSFLIHSAAVTTILLLDDAFMFHEVIFPEYFGIPQKGVYGGYLLIIIHYLYKQRHILMNKNSAMLAAAFLFFGISVFFDAALKTLPHQTLYEDGFKLLGIVSWFTFYYRFCINYISGIYKDLSFESGTSIIADESSENILNN